MSAERGNFRLSDAERQEAIDALSEHVRTGRLDLDEYGERSAQVTAAKAAADLAPLFTDLPAPRPSALHSAAAPIRSEPARAPRWRRGAILPIAALTGLVLLVFVPRMPLVFVLLVVVAVAGVVFARKRGA